jgi:Concanavalin A-like lectin/glucanases superfamily
MSVSRKRAGRQGPGSSTPARPCELATAQASAFPTTDGAEIEAFAGSNPKGPAAHRPSTCTGRALPAPPITFYGFHQASGGGTVTITSSVAIVNDTTWSTIVGTWRPGRFELYVDGFSRAASTAAATSTSALFGIYRWGWGFSANQDFNSDIALILCCGACWTGHLVRRWHADPFGFLRPWNEVPALMGSAPPATSPSTRTGVVSFLMA